MSRCFLPQGTNRAPVIPASPSHNNLSIGLRRLVRFDSGRESSGGAAEGALILPRWLADVGPAPEVGWRSVLHETGGDFDAWDFDAGEEKLGVILHHVERVGHGGTANTGSEQRRAKCVAALLRGVCKRGPRYGLSRYTTEERGVKAFPLSARREKGVYVAKASFDRVRPDSRDMTVGLGKGP